MADAVVAGRKERLILPRSLLESKHPARMLALSVLDSFVTAQTPPHLRP